MNNPQKWTREPLTHCEGHNGKACRRARVEGERFCTECRYLVRRKMKRDNYLTQIPEDVEQPIMDDGLACPDDIGLIDAMFLDDDSEVS